MLDVYLIIVAVIVGFIIAEILRSRDQRTFKRDARKMIEQGFYKNKKRYEKVCSYLYRRAQKDLESKQLFEKMQHLPFKEA